LFFLTLLLTLKYSGFIVLKDALCKGMFQEAEGLTVPNTCSGILGAPLTQWASQRCASARSNGDVQRGGSVARRGREQLCAGAGMGV